MKKKLIFALVVIGFGLGAGQSSADRAQTLIGNTSVGPTWQRPVADGSVLSGQNGPMRYIAQEFKLRQSTTYILVTTGFNNTHAGSFQNYIQCDDDAQPIQGSCGNYSTISSEKSICLQDRFLVAIRNVTNHPSDGIATPVRTGTNDTSLFWFYNDRNWEVMVKVLNGCAINGHYWVFAGALTNQGYEILVTDMTNQFQRRYANPLFTRAAAVADTTAFPCN
jgi:hypothetical protein